jgi:hypothetical protein
LITQLVLQVAALRILAPQILVAGRPRDGRYVAPQVADGFPAWIGLQRTQPPEQVQVHVVVNFFKVGMAKLACALAGIELQFETENAADDGRDVRRDEFRERGRFRTFIARH